MAARRESTSGDDTKDWVRIQKRTFTNWTNLQLAAKKMSIEDIKTDFMDGTSLTTLVEVLSKKDVPREKNMVQVGTATTKVRHGRMGGQANVEKALAFLQNEENVKMVNIGAFDIAEENLTIILGLVWTLILHYHIAEGKEGVSLKQYKSDLLHWVQSIIGPGTAYGIDIKNFNNDWKSGKALAALVDAFCPGQYEDWAEKEDKMEKNTRAIVLAQEQLDIPGILAPQDVGLDELSLVAYLDYFWDVNKKNAVVPRKEGQGYEEYKAALDARSPYRGNNAPKQTTVDKFDKDGKAKPAWKILMEERNLAFHHVRLTWG